jgi:hypothetical protein
VPEVCFGILECGLRARPPSGGRARPVRVDSGLVWPQAPHREPPGQTSSERRIFLFPQTLSACFYGCVGGRQARGWERRCAHTFFSPFPLLALGHFGSQASDCRGEIVPRLSNLASKLFSCVVVGIVLGPGGAMRVILSQPPRIIRCRALRRTCRSSHVRRSCSPPPPLPLGNQTGERACFLPQGRGPRACHAPLSRRADPHEARRIECANIFPFLNFSFILFLLKVRLAVRARFRLTRSLALAFPSRFASFLQAYHLCNGRKIIFYAHHE